MPSYGDYGNYDYGGPSPDYGVIPEYGEPANNDNGGSSSSLPEAVNIPPGFVKLPDQYQQRRTTGAETQQQQQQWQPQQQQQQWQQQPQQPPAGPSMNFQEYPGRCLHKLSKNVLLFVSEVKTLFYYYFGPAARFFFQITVIITMAWTRANRPMDSSPTLCLSLYLSLYLSPYLSLYLRLNKV